MIISVKIHFRGRANHNFKWSCVPFVSLCLLLSGCASVPKSYTEGTAFYKNGDYTAAARSFDQAAPLMLKDDTIPLILAEAHFKAAEDDSKKAEANDQLNLPVIIGLYTAANDHANKSIAALKPFLDTPDIGPGFSDKIQKLADDKYKTPRELRVSQNTASLKFKALNDEKLQTTQAKLDKLLGETTRLLALNRATPGSAYDEFVPYFPYAQYVPEVRDAKLEMEQLTIKKLNMTGLAQVNALKYELAEKTFTRLGTIQGGENIANAGEHSIAGHKAFMKKAYAPAFDELLAIRPLYPESPFLKEYYEKTQLLLMKVTLAEVDALIAKGKLSGLMNAFEKLAKISDATMGAAQGSPTFLVMIDQRKKTLRSMVAADFIHRAASLKQQDAMLYSSLILRSLRLARQFDPEQVKGLEEEVVNANGVTAKKSEMRVYVSYEGSADLNLEWAKRLESDLLGVLEKSGIPGVTIVDKYSLKGADPSDLGVVDLAIKGSIDAVEFVEKGRDSPRRRSSKYISGTRQVNNPAYPVAWQECRDAEASYNALYSDMERLKQRCNNLDGVFAQAACQMGISMISSSAKDSACGKAQGTREKLTENVISNYQYDFYTVSLSDSVHSKCSLVDNLSRTETQCTPINEKARREGTINANTQPTDTEGIKDVEDHVPDMAKEKEDTYLHISKTVSDELLQKVAALRGERFCKLAESLKDNLIGIEASSMCAFLVDKEQQKRQVESDTKLNAYFLVSPAQAQVYGVQSSDEVAAWPTSLADVDDKDLQKMKIKMAKR